jgi:hypothetical protein
VFVIDEGDRLVGASARFLQLLDAEEEEVVGRLVSDFVGETGGIVETGTTQRVSILAAGGLRYSARLRRTPIEAVGERPLCVAVLSHVHPEEAPLAQPENAAVARRKREEGEFEEFLRARLGTVLLPHQLIAGRIEIISLDEVKSALGERWPKHAGKAKAIARSVLAKRLAAEDVFAEAEGDSFIVCFGALDVAQGRTKTELIAREIHERLLGASAAPVRVATQVERVDIGDAELAQTSVLSALMSELDAARARRQRTIAAGISEVLAGGTLRLSPVLNRTLDPTGLVMARIVGENGACLSDIDPVNEDQRLLSRLDSLLLALVLKHICARRCGTPAGVIVPVHYSTLRDNKRSLDYIMLCNRMHESERRRVMFELVGTPPDVPTLRLEQILGSLAPFSARRILRASNLGQRFHELSRYRIAMLSILASPAHIAVPQSVRAFRSFASRVRGNESVCSRHRIKLAKLLVYGVQGEAAARWYCSNGADFLCRAPSDDTADPSAAQRATLLP